MEKTENFPEHEVIVVHHQYGVTHYSTSSFATTAMNAGWDYEIFNSAEELAEAFGDEVPDEYTGAVAEYGFPIVHEWDGGSWDLLKSGNGYDPESSAQDYLADDLNRLIVIDTLADAEFYANEYRGHEQAKVQAAAERIIEKYSDEEE